jgi:hypothetical protein
VVSSEETAECTGGRGGGSSFLEKTRWMIVFMDVPAPCANARACYYLFRC